MDRMVTAFAEKNAECSVVYLGAGLETAYDRLHEKLPGVHWYECDLPEVIEARQKVFGQREREITIPGDMFKMEWTKSVDPSLPTLLIISGVFQYFHEEEIVTFIRNCKLAFPGAEMIFDATSRSGLLYTNWFIKRTGNTETLMYFGVDDSEAFARKCATVLLEEKTFYPDALKILGKKLSLVTRISMKTAERNKLAKILHLKLTDKE